MTSAEDGGAETTQYLILQGPDDGKGVPCGIWWWLSLPFESVLQEQGLERVSQLHQPQCLY